MIGCFVAVAAAIVTKIMAKVGAFGVVTFLGLWRLCTQSLKAR